MLVGFGTLLLLMFRFFMAISRALVNSDGRADLVPDPLVWSEGSLGCEVIGGSKDGRV